MALSANLNSSMSLQTQESSDTSLVSRKFSLPQIILTEWNSNQLSSVGVDNPACDNHVSISGSSETSEVSLEEVSEWSYSRVTDHGEINAGDQCRLPLSWTGDLNSMDSSVVYNLDSNLHQTEPGIVGFLITNDSIVSLTAEDKTNLEESGDMFLMNTQSLGGMYNETLTKNTGDQTENEYKQLLDITQSGLEGSKGLDSIQDVQGMIHEKNEKFGESNTHKWMPESSRDHPHINKHQKVQELLKPITPVPKPRQLQVKETKCTSSKSLVSKHHNIALSHAIQVPSNLKVIDVQKMINSYSESKKSYLDVLNNSVSEDSSNRTWKSMDICKSTYKCLDSLEESIRELELTINEFPFQSSATRKNVQHEIQEHAEIGSDMKQEKHDLPHVNENVSIVKSLPSRSSKDLDINGSARTKPPLLPKPQISKSGVSIPPMKMVGSRLKTVQQSSGDKSSKHSKQRMEYMRIQGHQQLEDK